MSRGLKPDMADSPSTGKTATGVTPLFEAVVVFMDGSGACEGTASELLSTLESATDDLRVDATRLSKALSKLASQLALRGIVVERMMRGRQRGIRLARR